MRKKHLEGKWCLPALSFLTITYLAIAVSACVGDRREEKWYEKSLDSGIGKPFGKAVYGSKSLYKYLSDDGNYYELQNELPNGCSYVWRIRKIDDVITSWRLTSDAALCNHHFFTGSR